MHYLYIEQQQRKLGGRREADTVVEVIGLNHTRVYVWFPMPTTTYMRSNRMSPTSTPDI